MDQPKMHVIVIGAGYAGMEATMRLAMRTRHQNVQITLINPSETFVERPRLHQMAANQVVKQRSIREVFRGTGVQFLRTVVTAIDVARQEVVTQAIDQTDGNSQRLAYDYLLYTPGSSIEQDSVPGIRQNAYTLTPSGQHSAEALRTILPELNHQGGSLVVVGGGPTGIEAAAEFAESYPALHVTLLTRGEVGETWGGKIQAHIRKTLAGMGVSLREQTPVDRVERNALLTRNAETIPFDLCLWAGGFVAPSLARESGIAVNERGQVLTDLYLRSLSSPHIYVAGDSAAPVKPTTFPVRMAAYTATITGAHAADSLYNAMTGKPQKPLNFAYLGQGIALGRHEAVGFNNFPDDLPTWPMFTGQAAVLGREAFVILLGDFARFERRFPGLHFWPGRGNGNRRPITKPSNPQISRRTAE